MAGPGRIDRLSGVIYFALSLAGCGGGTPGPVLPTGAVPATGDAARAWFGPLQVSAPVLYRFRWSYRDLEGSAGGRGTARIVRGDSLRFDVVGPLGSGRGAAFVIGDSAEWAQPEEDVRKLVPNYPLLWAMLGIPRLPTGFDEVSRFEDGRLVAWRFVTGGDTVEVARMHGPPARLITDVRRAGGRLGRVETRFGPDGAPASARLIVPGTPARLDITYVSTSRPEGFPSDTWRRPDQP